MNGLAIAAQQLARPGKATGGFGATPALSNEDLAALEAVRSCLERVKRFPGKVKEELAQYEGWDP